MDHFSHDPSSSASHRHEDSNAESTAAAGTGTGPPHKRSRLSHDVSSPSIQEPHSIERRSPATSSGPRRAAQACLRCRKQKLRCLGGKPCARCIKADRECDFGKPGQQPGGLEDANGSKATLVRGASARLENLESSVANLLAGLSRPGIQQGSDTSGRIDDGAVNGNWSYPVDPLPHPPLTSFGTAVPLQQYQHIPPQPSPSSLGDSATVSLGWQGDFAELQAAPSDTGEDPGSSSMSKGKSKGKGVEPEERLAVATQDEIQPPFKALVFHPAVWENQERSRLNSPHTVPAPLPSTIPDHNPSRPLTRGSSADDKDPVSSGLIDLPTARSLFQFYVTHCHLFLPIIDISLDDPFAVVQQCPLLLSTVIAIAARLHGRYHIIRHEQNTAMITLDAGMPDALARLAEEHLGKTLLRKQHALSDVRAILLLAAWGLQGGGAGPDAWVLTGHAMRIAQRLGVHRVVNMVVDGGGPTKIAGREDRETIPKWRAWLAWYSFDAFLSLGFGRYQTTRTDAVDEEAFLRARLDQPIPRPGTSASLLLYGDTYLTSITQLSKLVRALVSWTERETSGMTPSSQRNEGLLSMLRDLNGRLDEWSKLWVWSESPYALYLGPSARIARLQAEHLRLSINSIALHSSVDQELDSIHPYLRKALNAATSTIQTHFESSQSDLALSFATDYLTITLAQAAIFLVRLAQAPLAVQTVLSLDKSVIAHYLTMSVDSLKLGDISETRLSTYLARTISEISRAAGIKLKSDEPSIPNDFATRGYHQEDVLSAPGPGLFDMDSFWAADDHFDLSEILGLSGNLGDKTDWLNLAGTGNGDPSEMFNSDWGVGDSSGGGPSM